jgi:uncharacterized protein
MMIVLDIYVFQAIKFVSQSAGSRTKLFIYITYWSISIIAVLTLILLPYLNLESWNKSFRAVLFAIIIALFFSKLIAAIFILIDDVRRLIQWTGNKFTSKPEGEDIYDGEKISRSNFLSWLGLVAGGGIWLHSCTGFPINTIIKSDGFLYNFPTCHRLLKDLNLFRSQIFIPEVFQTGRLCKKGLSRLCS